MGGVPKRFYAVGEKPFMLRKPAADHSNPKLPAALWRERGLGLRPQVLIRVFTKDSSAKKCT